jgi:hypothetical protein
MRTNYAYDKYNQGLAKGSVTTAVPRSKFQFTASLTTIEQTIPLDKIASMSMPGWTSSAMTMNAYNRKKIVQTNYDYTPITVVAYDTREDKYSIESFLKKYSQYYFGGPMNVNGLYDFDTGAKGFKLQQSRNYIKTLNILRTESKTDANIITIYNPIITNIDADTLDYSDSQLVQYRLTFVYEGFDIRSTNSGQ